METQTRTLAEFLLVRLAEDDFEVSMGRTTLTPHWQGRTLREIEIKRRIVLEVMPHRVGCGDGREGDVVHWSAKRIHDQVLRLLALPYADHPDFDPEWRI